MASLKKKFFFFFLIYTTNCRQVIESLRVSSLSKLKSGWRRKMSLFLLKLRGHTDHLVDCPSSFSPQHNCLSTLNKCRETCSRGRHKINIFLLRSKSVGILWIILLCETSLKFSVFFNHDDCERMSELILHSQTYPFKKKKRKKYLHQKCTIVKRKL